MPAEKETEMGAKSNLGSHRPLAPVLDIRLYAANQARRAWAADGESAGGQLRSSKKLKCPLDS
jgi:hypothetical protein